MQVSKLRKVAAVAAVLLTASATMLPAHADPGSDRSRTPIAQANPQISVELLDALPESILNDAIHVDADISPDTPFLIADEAGNVTVAPGQSKAQTEAAKRLVTGSELDLQALASCSTRASVPGAIPTKPTTVVVTSSCAAIIGRTPDVTVKYRVTKGCNACYPISWAPWGFNKKWGVIGGKPPLKPVYGWIYTGAWMIGRVGDQSVTVPWGQNAAKAKVRFINGSTNGWSGTFAP